MLTIFKALSSGEIIFLYELNLFLELKSFENLNKYRDVVMHLGELGFLELCIDF